MSRGSQPGERRGGRSKGTPNKRTARDKAEMAATGEMPLDYMLRIMRDPKAEPARRDDMAKAAAKFCHSARAAVEVTGKDGGPVETKTTDTREMAKAILAILATAAEPKPA